MLLGIRNSLLLSHPSLFEQTIGDAPLGCRYCQHVWGFVPCPLGYRIPAPQQTTELVEVVPVAGWLPVPALLFPQFDIRTLPHGHVPSSLSSSGAFGLMVFCGRGQTDERKLPTETKKLPDYCSHFRVQVSLFACPPPQ